MIDIFKLYAPYWKRIVAEYAKAVWENSVTQKLDQKYDSRARIFAKEYRYALEKHYAEKDIRVFRGTLDGWVAEWEQKQQALKDTLKVIAQDKQNKLVEQEIEKLRYSDDTQAVIDRLYDARENETVYKVFSFKDNFQGLARQKAGDNAYDLGTGINERIIQSYSDRYFWKTQKDVRVRETHQELQSKCFLFSDPPTTIDRYGRRHTGNPGTDYGCRCWAEPAPESEKPLRNYVVRARKAA
jgi:uncharacterized protein with gpF-like domain